MMSKHTLIKILRESKFKAQKLNSAQVTKSDNSNMGPFVDLLHQVDSGRLLNNLAWIFQN